MVIGDVPLLSLLVLAPAAGAAIVAVLPEHLRRLAGLLASGLVLAGVLLLAATFDATIATPQWLEVVASLPSIGAAWTVGVDGLSIWPVVVVALLGFVSLLAMTPERAPARALGVVLCIEAGAIGLLVARDLLMFFVFWELLFGAARRLRAPSRAGSAVAAIGTVGMLAAVLQLHAHGGDSFAYADIFRAPVGSGDQPALLGALALALLPRSGLFPMHGWLKRALDDRQPARAALCGTLFVGTATWTLARFAPALCPDAVGSAAAPLLAVAAGSLGAGAWAAWHSRSTTDLAAATLTWAAGMGVVGWTTATTAGLEGATLLMVTIGPALAAWLLLSAIQTRAAGLAACLPAAAGFVPTVTILSTTMADGLPLDGTSWSWAATSVAVLGVATLAVLAAAAIRLATPTPEVGPASGDGVRKPALPRGVAVGLIVGSLAIGCHPRTVLEPMHATVEALGSATCPAITSSRTPQRRPRCPVPDGQGSP